MTKFCYLIGNPVEHSVSPIMYNAAFKKLKLDFLYLSLKTEAKDLKNNILMLKGKDVQGANITIPFKVSVMRYLDKVEKLAKEIGAVNTILNDNGKLIGFNTDGPSALKALEKYENPKEKKIVILGAGGAARAITYFLLKKCPKELVIINRTFSKAKKLEKKLKNFYPNVTIKAFPLQPKYLKKELNNAEIIINCTSVGMFPNINETPIPKKILKKDSFLMDIIYNPLETRLLREAKEKGLRTINGVEMLVYQGAISFEIWTGKRAPINLMKKVVLKALTENEV